MFLRIKKKLSTKLLDRLYKCYQHKKNTAIQMIAKEGRRLTITSDEATITQRSLSNVVAAILSDDCLIQVLVHIDDATSLLTEPGFKKDAEYVAKVISIGIDKVGPSNVAHDVTDCAPVMIAAQAILLAKYPCVIFAGCICHKLNTLFKHICAIPQAQVLISTGKLILRHPQS